MAGSDVTVIMSGDDARLAAAQRRAARNQDNLTDSVGKTGRGAKTADTSLERFASRLARDNAKPLEKAYQNLQQIQRAYDRVLITHQTYDRSVRETVRNLARQAQITERQAAAQLGVSRSYAAGSGWGGRLAGGAGDLMSTLGVPLTALAGVSMVTSVLSDLAAIKSRNKEQSLDMLMGRETFGELAQMANTVDELAKRRLAAESLYRMGATSGTGAAGLEEAKQMAFSIQSAGLGDEMRKFGEMASRRLVDPRQIADLAKATAAVRSTVGKGEDPMKIIAQAMAASEEAPTKMPELLSGTARVGTEAKAFKMATADAMALVATLSESKGGWEEGSTRGVALLRALNQYADTHLKGLTVQQSVRKIESLKLGNKELQELLGSSEAVDAFRVMAANMTKFESAAGKVRQAESAMIDQRIGVLKQDSDAVLAHAKRVAEATAALGNKKSGRYAAAADAVVADRAAAARNAGYGEWAVAAGEKRDSMLRGAVGDKSFLERALTGPLSPEARRAANLALGRPENAPRESRTRDVMDLLSGNVRGVPWIMPSAKAAPTPSAAAFVAATGAAQAAVPMPGTSASTTTPKPPAAVPQMTATVPSPQFTPADQIGWQSPPVPPMTGTVTSPSLQEALDAAIQMGARDMEKEIRAEMQAKGITPRATAASDTGVGTVVPPELAGAAAGVPLSIGGGSASGLERLMSEVLGELRWQTGLMRERGPTAGGAMGSPQPASPRGALLAEAEAYA